MKSNHISKQKRNTSSRHHAHPVVVYDVDWGILFFCGSPWLEPHVGQLLPVGITFQEQNSVAFSFKHLNQISVLLILVLFVGCGSTIKKLSELHELNGIYYVKGTNEKYTGNYIAYSDKSKIKILEANFINGKFDGKIMAWGEDGAKREEKVYKDGLLNGTSSTWIGNNLKISDQEYQNDKLNGKSFLWNKNGVKIAEVVYKDDLQNGITTKWNDYGIKVSEANFKNDELNGKLTLWNEKGIKIFEGYYKDGKLNGKKVEWNVQGIKIFEGEYKNDLLNGLSAQWDEAGIKKLEAKYIDGKLNGIGIIFGNNGKKTKEGHYLNDKVNGLFTVWDEDGNKIKEENYIEGKLNGLATVWDKQGNKILEAEYKDGNNVGKATFWFDGIKVKADVKNGILNGQSSKYNELGAMIEEAYYLNGKLEGKLTKWDDKGTKISEEEYKNDKLNGRAMVWDQNGDKVSEVEYVDGKLNGKEIVRDNSQKSLLDDINKNRVILKQEFRPDEAKDFSSKELKNNSVIKEEEFVNVQPLSKILIESKKTLGASIFINTDESYIVVYETYKKLGFALNEAQSKVLKTSIESYTEALKKISNQKENPSGEFSTFGNIKVKKVLVRAGDSEHEHEIKEVNLFLQLSSQGEYKESPVFIIVLPKIKTFSGINITESTQRLVFSSKDIEKIQSVIDNKMSLDKQLLQEQETVESK
jgi:antitoxin component YwqK of YwqJK toxin-antitoxin module